jgi:transcriptional regulator with XRE-family HTH domain
MENASQPPMEYLDLSVILRQIMAVRRLSVSDMAKAAGVSKSAMEKYIAGPSSPRLVAIAALSRALGLSLDQIVFGEIDADEEMVYRIAFREMDTLILDLKSDEDLKEKRSPITPVSSAQLGRGTWSPMW